MKTETEPKGSCSGCRWLFATDEGYSNWTVTDTEIHCVLNRNPKLPAQMPDDNFHDSEEGSPYSPYMPRHPCLEGRRCDQYDAMPADARMHLIDCDRTDVMTEDGAQQYFLQTGDPMPLLIARYSPE